jgi:hypothetical protein
MRIGIDENGLKRVASVAKSAQEGGYQGWANYETWVVALWLDNDQGSYEYWREVLDELRSEEGGFRSEYDPESVSDEDLVKRELADRLKADHEEAMPEVDGVYADLLNAALSEVDWREIAENVMSE